MQLIDYPDRKQWPSLMKRPLPEYQSFYDSVREIVGRVKNEGDRALYDLTSQFDGVALESLIVPHSEMVGSENEVSSTLRTALATAYRTIDAFHSAQRRTYPRLETLPGVEVWQEGRAIHAVGLYVPGGTAPLVSTVLMLAIPARIAGCEKIVLCTPPNKDGKVHPAVLYAARMCGIDTIYRVGGAQAIAAMTYGTETIPRVNKLFGPGNLYVTVAKQLAAIEGVAIDLPAGPTELLVIADETANPKFVAADLLSQAEHGADSQVILAVTDANLRKRVIDELEIQRPLLGRSKMISGALDHSRAILFPSIQEAMEFSNSYAPEHLILAVKNPEILATHVAAAGSVFLGHFTPESVGDYASGTNHTLPTNGCAAAWSGVTLDSFLRTVTFQNLSRQGISQVGSAVIEMAEVEGLSGHARAVAVRLEECDRAKDC